MELFMEFDWNPNNAPECAFALSAATDIGRGLDISPRTQLIQK
jgi:hypothetical protein